MMAENQKYVFIRFNMDDRTDRELYEKLVEKSRSASSLTAYVKRVLEEYFSLNIKIADRQVFHNQMLAAIRERERNMRGTGAAGDHNFWTQTISVFLIMENLAVRIFTGDTIRNF